MKKNIQSITALLLLLLLAVGIFPPASAVEVQPDNYLGGPDDLSGYIVPDNDQKSTRSNEHLFPIEYEGGGVIHHLVFAITAANVTDLLTSKQGNKSFTLSSLPSSATYLSFDGTLYHPLNGAATQETIKYGVFHYDSLRSIFVANTADYIKTGETANDKFKISDKLSNNVTYYTYINNTSKASYIYGDLALYYSAA